MDLNSVRDILRCRVQYGRFSDAKTHPKDLHAVRANYEQFLVLDQNSRVQKGSIRGESTACALFSAHCLASVSTSGLYHCSASATVVSAADGCAASVTADNTRHISILEVTEQQTSLKIPYRALNNPARV